MSHACASKIDFENAMLCYFRGGGISQQFPPNSAPQNKEDQANISSVGCQGEYSAHRKGEGRSKGICGFSGREQDGEVNFEDMF